MNYEFLHPSFFILHNCLVMVGLDGLEPSTSRLSVVCSSQLSYRPLSASTFCAWLRWLRLRFVNVASATPPHLILAALPATKIRTLKSAVSISRQPLGR